MVDEEITDQDNLTPLSDEEKAVVEKYYNPQKTIKTMGKKSKLAVVLLLSLVILISFLGSAHATGINSPGQDTILSPINNSDLAFVGTNTTYTLTYYVNNIHGNITNDTIGIYVNGLLYNISTHTTNGPYNVPIHFYSQGTYSISLKSTTQNNTVTFIYTVTQNQSLIFGYTFEFWLLIIAAIITFIAIGVSVFRH